MRVFHEVTPNLKADLYSIPCLILGLDAIALDFIELARQSPIVPIGRETLFGKALSLGFNQDFAASIHILAPQIEHMVRFRLQYAGVTTTHLDQEGIETEVGLSILIDIPETKVIFGENLAYELKALFCDPLGPNLRNYVAHGLLDDQHSNSVDAVYAWWLALKLVFGVFWQSIVAAGLGEQQVGDDKGGVEQSESVDSAN